jgi:protein-S-isoprenylcysteine O-methyltransferase Ste14
MKNFLRHLSSFIAPVVFCFILPYFIVGYESRLYNRPSAAPSTPLLVLGLLISLAGLILLVVMVRMFILIGQGTIMPWDPTRHLVVSGPYAHVRNPMILSVITIQAGEAIAFFSPIMALLASLFFVINTVYFIYSEEPGLEKRFGTAYLEYKRNVPRWLPRLKPWRPVS